jgi:hypothetical protein
MRVRISFDALRLCLLVAAGVTSGYLWRAAFEASSPAEQRVAATPRVVHPAPAPPTVRIAPRRLTPPAKRSAAPRVVSHTVVHSILSPSTLLVSQPVAAPAQSTPPSSPKPKPTPAPAPKPTPKPTPKPSPAPPPPTTTTPPPATTPQPVAAPPVQQPTSQPPTTTPPPVQQPADDGSRPGWGKGDKNHDHTGPGGGKPN